MRLLFLFLLLINGFIYLWYAFYPQPVGAAPVTLDTTAPRLILLSELPAVEAEKIVSTSEIDQVNKSLAEVMPEKLCYTLGPFMNSEAVTEAIQTLILSGRPFEKRKSEKKEQIGYWVFLPPFESRAAATEVAEEFRLLGDKHYYVVKESAEHANAISLGVFTGKSNALSRYRQIKKLGYEAKLEGRYRQSPVFWIDYTEGLDSQSLSTEDFVGAHRLPRDCEVIASSAPLP